MSDHTPTGILREIDEEIRQEHYKALWQRYGSIVIGLVLVLVLGVAGFKAWQAYDRDYRTQKTETLRLFLMDTVNGNEDGVSGVSMEVFTEQDWLSNTSGIDALAAITKAGALARENVAMDEALALLWGVAHDDGVMVQIQEYALVLWAHMAANSPHVPTAEAVKEALAPLLIGGAWRLVAQEAVAFNYLKEGNGKEARSVLQSIIDDAETTDDTRTRLQAIVQSLQGSS